MTNEMTQRVKTCDIEVWWPECHPRYPKERQDSPKLSSDLQRTVIAHVYVHVTSAPPTHTNNEYIWKLEKNKKPVGNISEGENWKALTYIYVK